MRFRSSYIPTLKESPADAEVISHKLLVRAGMVRKLTSGIYVYMPLALRSLKKIENIIREEMAAAGFEELLLPAVQPGDLWKESGRWEHYGKELLRFKDRNDRDYCLGPTHEEVITDLVRGEVRSYRQLPARLFQIQTKFRDEIRPRFGLMRGREFIMKDGYSFDLDDAGAEASYMVCKKAYNNIFSRLGLRFRAVEADSGSIGGNFSHEFHVLADAGEDTIASCTACDYAANIERAEIRFNGAKCEDACAAMEEVATPNAHTVEEVCALLGLEPKNIVKTMIFVVDGKPVAVLVRGDREVNDVKVGLDLAFLDGRLSLETEYYRRLTKGAVDDKPLYVTTGFTHQAANFARLRNRGIEFTLRGGIVQTRDWTLDASVNFAFNSNKVLEYASSVSFQHMKLNYYEGYPARALIGGKVVGIDPLTGLYEFKLRPDAVISSDADYTDEANDLYYLGNREAPFNGGFSISAGYRNLRLSVNGVFSFGSYAYDRNESPATYSQIAAGSVSTMDRAQTEYSDLYSNHLNVWKDRTDRWTETNTTGTKYPRIYDSFDAKYHFDQSNPTANAVVDGIYIYKISYVRIKNITLSYEQQPSFAGQTRYYTTLSYGYN